ncbi:LysR substrate-binding domain-containing protein, partial [Franconibacter pulveris]
VDAAAAGLGIAYVPELSALEALNAGRLVKVLEAWCPEIPGLFLYFPANRHIPASLRAFIGIIREYNAGDLPQRESDE